MSETLKQTSEELETVMKKNTDTRFQVTRRTVLEAGTAAAALSFIGHPQAALAAGLPDADPPPDSIAVGLQVNGRRQTLTLDPRTTLLDALRERLGLTGTKKGCDQGQCGACTVIVNGQRINSCLTLAVMHADDEITTIEGLTVEGLTVEGLANGDGLHPMQAAFVRRDGFQCGYCTPGQICSAVAVLAEHKAGWPSYVTADVATAPALTNAEIAERMSGNICRCSAYPNIVAAIRDVAEGGRS
jgi:xanthine dehydrogenase YagT iron-sulfur-binding subunit